MRYPCKDAELDSKLLLLLGLCVWVWSGIHPVERDTWLLEQVATGIAGAVLYAVGRRVQFTRLAKLGLFALFCTHTVGTHYTYSLTPYNEFSQGLFGTTINDLFGWQRNHYDRFVHWIYGFCSAAPIHQILKQKLALSHAVSAFFCLQLVLSTSVLYELLEWGAAVLIGGEVGAEYLGTQGDIWDAQADMALAGMGCLSAYLLHWMTQFRARQS